MDWQQPAALALVAVTALLLLRGRALSRRRARSRACGSDCACSTPETGANDLAAKGESHSLPQGGHLNLPSKGRILER